MEHWYVARLKLMLTCLKKFAVVAVKVKDTFMHYNHQCIVFELLPMSLFDLLEHTNFVGVSISMIQQFGKSLLATLGFLAAG